MHLQYPVIETGAIAWKAIMLPLHQRCLVEDVGIDPTTSRMQSERSTIWARPPFRYVQDLNLCGQKPIRLAVWPVNRSGNITYAVSRIWTYAGRAQLISSQSP